jgi:hypothetical protein
MTTAINSSCLFTHLLSEISAAFFLNNMASYSKFLKYFALKLNLFFFKLLPTKSLFHLLSTDFEWGKMKNLGA